MRIFHRASKGVEDEANPTEQDLEAWDDLFDRPEEEEEEEEEETKEEIKEEEEEVIEDEEVLLAPEEMEDLVQEEAPLSPEEEKALRALQKKMRKKYEQWLRSRANDTPGKEATDEVGDDEAEEEEELDALLEGTGVLVLDPVDVAKLLGVLPPDKDDVPERLSDVDLIRKYGGECYHFSGDRVYDEHYHPLPKRLVTALGEVFDEYHSFRHDYLRDFYEHLFVPFKNYDYRYEDTTGKIWEGTAEGVLSVDTYLFPENIDVYYADDLIHVIADLMNEKVDPSILNGDSIEYLWPVLFNYYQQHDIPLGDMVNAERLLNERLKELEEKWKRPLRCSLMDKKD